VRTSRARALALACWLAPVAFAQSDDPAKSVAQALPVVHDGFAIDLIAQAPEILWPSAVHCLDDGSLLIAEDRMDMPGPTDQPLDKVWLLRWNDDGLTYKKTLFCDQLFATFGLQQIDDAVYVMNMPHLTVLRDHDGDGVAEERKELLTDLGPPAPGWPGGFNDHIVSGIRLGMDGFLYIAVGDKGIPLAHGTDGRTLTLRGGGVVRVRPDGSRLEVVASGLRNILDVAIDERGEMFTYDNTDDGLGWWTRLTHIIPGGYYGYPWDYHDHPERMLPCMAEYGGGSPTGGLVYREAAWPPPYQGSLFFCEWAKSALRRFELEPDGATFKVKLAEDFITAGEVKEFRPLDICESPDGRFLYLSDWGYGGWTANVESGRLWRIRRADDNGKSLGGTKIVPKGFEIQVLALNRPSFRERIAIQRVVATDEGWRWLIAWANLDKESSDVDNTSEIGSLDRIFGNHSETVARHALWAMVASGEHCEDALAKLCSNVNADTRAQAALAATASGSMIPSQLVELLRDPDPRVQRSVASVLWWGNAPPGTTEQLLLALANCRDPVLRDCLRQALRRCGDWDQVVQALPKASPEDQRDLLLAMCEQYEKKAVECLARVISSKGEGLTELRTQSLMALSSSHRKPEPWDGKWWNIQPAKTKPPPKVVDWEGTPIVVGAVRAALADPQSEMRRAALECVREMPERSLLPQARERWEVEKEEAIRAQILDVLAELKDGDAAPLLEAILRDKSVSDELRGRAVKVAAAIGTAEMVDVLCGAAGEKDASVEQVVACVEALGRLKLDSATIPVRAALTHADERVRSAGCEALASMLGAGAEDELVQALGDPSKAVQVSAVRALGGLKLESSTQALLRMASDDATRAEAILALARSPDPAAFEAYLAGLDEKSLQVRVESRAALAAIRDAVRERVDGLAKEKQLSATALAELQKIYRDPQPVREWRLLGPFPRDGAPAIEKGEIDFGHKHSVGDQEIAWSVHEGDAKDGFLDLEKALASKSSVYAFAACTVESSREREVEIAAGSDDSLTVWINGEQVHDFPGDRAWSADADRFTARLRQGSNAIVLRVGQTGGQWSFNFKVSGDESGPLFETEARVPTLEDYREFALANTGDASRGARVFRNPTGAMCIRCHTVLGEGEKVGPDLTDVGAKYPREELIASVLQPSKRMAEGYKAVAVRLTDDERVFGQIRKQDAREIVLVDTSGNVLTIDRSEIVEIRDSPLSVMPDGLATLFTTQEFADLVAYLESLKGAAKR
jgi:putative membrane-bound dehydrogenase-like protein